MILFEFAAVIVCQIKKFPLIKKTVAGKQPLPLKRSSLKTTGLEYSTNQMCIRDRCYTSRVAHWERAMEFVAMGSDQC